MARHRRDRCMNKGCEESPEREFLWAEGLGRAWFCVLHRDAWEAANPSEIVRERSVLGKVGKSWVEREPDA